MFMMERMFDLFLDRTVTVTMVLLKETPREIAAKCEV